MSSHQNIVILYQGTCSFCNWCREFIERRAIDGTFLFIPIESQEGKNIITDRAVIIDADHPESIAFISAGRPVLYKWEACLAIGEKLSVPWKQLAYMMRIVPVRVGDALYTWVGKHRGLMCRIVFCRKIKS